MSPKSRKRKIPDREKLDACLDALREIVFGEPEWKVLNADLRQKLGAGWTVIVAMQWLTGKSAWTAIEQMPTDDPDAKLRKDFAIAALQVAATVCKDLDASGGADSSLERVRAVIVQRLR